MYEFVPGISTRARGEISLYTGSSGDLEHHEETKEKVVTKLPSLRNLRICFTIPHSLRKAQPHHKRWQTSGV